MKKVIYVFLIAFITICFSGCNRNKWDKYITCTSEEKENIFCNYNLDPVCWDNWLTYWNACVACSSNNINSYKLWECKICDERGVCSLWDFQEDDFYEEWEINNLGPKEIFIEVPTPNF